MSYPETLPESNHVPRAYSSDNGFTISGMMLTIAVGVFVAIAVGLLAGVIGQFFYMVLIFPVAIGGAVGGAQVAVIGRSKVRNPLVCGFAGLIGGVIAVASMHYVDYVAFQKSMAEANVEYAESQQVMIEIEDEEYREAYAAALAEYEADPVLEEARSIQSFPAYMEWAAEQGVELSSARSTQSGSNLGYVGTYIYWGLEALIIAGMCVFMTRSRAAQPFCENCESWMTETELVTLTCDAKSASKLVQSGRLDRLPTKFDANKETVISVFGCEKCERSPIVVQPNDVTYNNGNRCKKSAGRHVFEASILPYLSELFYPVEQSDDDVVDRLESQVTSLARDAALHADSNSSDVPSQQPLNS